MLKTMIGVMGSVAGYHDQAGELSYQLGQAIAKHDCIIVTGACPGLPYDSVRGAKDAGGLTVGISPGHNFAEHTIKYTSPSEGFDVIIYTGSGLMGREITGVRSCDIVVLVGGRSGTLGEFAIAYDEGKVIGVLKGTGGIAEHIATLVEVIQKETGAQVIYDEDPDRLISTLVEVDAARKQARTRDTLIPVLPDCTPEACFTANSLEQAISTMEGEIRILQANIAEQRQRLEAMRDLLVLGAPAKG
ncbi:MAG: SLOG cluster 4 domain-containing protein [Armatimonadota bacterium]